MFLDDIEAKKHVRVFGMTFKFAITKGQLISKAIYSALDSPKKRTKKI